MKVLLLAPVLVLGCGLAAQQSIGTVALEDATVTGDLSVTSDRATLLGSSSLTAKDHAAELALTRGGAVRVCSTSSLHVTQGQGNGTQPLLLALDRGAVEVQTGAVANDVILTPDLRFSVAASAPLDLRLRVTRNGDTCVENRGTSAPILAITSNFTDATYQLGGGQHVLFEHGNLKEVVDNESSPCGCPPPAPPSHSLAEALLAPGTPGAPTTAAAEHPFPAAISQGLAAPPPVPHSTPGAANAQVSTRLDFSGDGTGTISGEPAKPALVPTALAPAAVVPAALPPPTLAHRVGHFFKRLFGG